MHEGGFRIEKDYRDRWFFRRPDGRAVPACGYRAADRIDDDVEMADEAVKAYLAAADAIRTSADVSTVRNPSAEVREPSAVTYLARGPSAEAWGAGETSAEVWTDQPSAQVFLSGSRMSLSGSGPTSAAAGSSPCY